MQKILISILICCSTASQVVAGDCNLVKRFDHKTKHHGTRTVYGDGGSLFFNAPMAVNTDGAPNSYHPDDPWGSSGKAINTICNGANAIMPGGEVIRYDQCSRLVKAFRAAKQSGWDNPRKPRIQFYGVAKKGYVPCLIEEGEYKGYFVSTTSLPADSSKGDCDQSRYLDSLEIPFAIYPKRSKFVSNGIGRGDVVVYYNKDKDIFDYGIIGDQGPKWGMAEGSVAFAKKLNDVDENPKTRRDTYNFAVKSVFALMLPKETLSGPFTAENVRSRAKGAFDAWGGKERFLACMNKLF